MLQGACETPLDLHSSRWILHCAYYWERSLHAPLLLLLLSTAILVLPPVTQSRLPAQLSGCLKLQVWKDDRNEENICGAFPLPPLPVFVFCCLRDFSQHPELGWGEVGAQSSAPAAWLTMFQCSKSHLRIFNLGLFFFYKNLLMMRTIPLSPAVELRVSLSILCTKSIKIHLETALPIPSSAIQELLNAPPSTMGSAEPGLAGTTCTMTFPSLSASQDPSCSHSHQHWAPPLSSSASSTASLPSHGKVYPDKKPSSLLSAWGKTPLALSTTAPENKLSCFAFTC